MVAVRGWERWLMRHVIYHLALDIVTRGLDECNERHVVMVVS